MEQAQELGGIAGILRPVVVVDVRSNFAIRTVKAPAPLPLGHLQP